MRIENINTRRIDHGVGVLRGVLSRPELALLAPHEVEAAIEHIRGAARFVERLQKKLAREKRAARTRLKRLKR